MKRLLDLPADHPLMSRAHDLIRATGPTPPSEARLQHVRRKLDQPASRPPVVRGLRAGIVLAVVGTGASALALGGAFDAPEPVVARAQLPSSTARAAVPPREPQAAPTAAEESSPALEEAAAPTLAQSSRRPAPARASASDVARVHEAARALRGEGKPERALQILEAGGEVSGPLAEEALALRIEAAARRGDARATTLARSYLARYPDGRYRELAQRTLRSKEP